MLRGFFPRFFGVKWWRLEEHERRNAEKPLPEGPFAKLLGTISLVQKRFEGEKMPIRTALVTARNAPAHERVIRTLRARKKHAEAVCERI